jgi:hypothetical protein
VPLQIADRIEPSFPTLPVVVLVHRLILGRHPGVSSG